MNKEFNMNLKYVFTLILPLIMCFFSFITNAAPKVLMVLSSYGQNAGETKPGFEFDEFSQSYSIFKKNGLAIDIASPKGGKVEADKYDASKPYNQDFLTDQQAVNKLDNSFKLSNINSSDYSAIFVVGGKGAMFDLPTDKNLQTLIANVYQNNGSIGAVCHGPAALVNVKLSNGDYLVANKKVNGFTNQEEALFGKKWSKEFDFLLETKLNERGANYQSSPMMLAHLASDERLFTGQNPASTAKVAEALVESLGITLVKRTPWDDERTYGLIAQVLDGKNNATVEYKTSSNGYQPQLLAMYGFYSLKSAKSDSEKLISLSLMELGALYFDHPKLSLTMAKGFNSLGQTHKAKSTLKALIKNHPEQQEAQQMLKTL